MTEEDTCNYVKREDGHLIHLSGQNWFQTEEEMQESVLEREIEASELNVSRMH